jgi:pimeloyl-ACP methyl ester carboxylesterase
MNFPPPDVDTASHRTVTIETKDAGSIDLHVLEAGPASAPAVLLLHGWPQHAWCWRGVIPALSPDFHVIAPDLRGFGWSDCPGVGYDPVTFASDGIALLDALGVERAFVGGHDWGGAAAFAMALSFPDRVERMLAANTVPPWTERSLRVIGGAWRAWYAFALAAVGDQVVQRPTYLASAMRRDVVHRDRLTKEDALVYTRPLAPPGPARATALLYRTYLRTIVGRAPGAELAKQRLTQPAHFLFGTNDRAISLALVDGVERHADQLALELVEDSGHFICDEKPELVAERARELFAP